MKVWLRYIHKKTLGCILARVSLSRSVRRHRKQTQSDGLCEDMLRCLFTGASENVDNLIIERVHQISTAVNLSSQDRHTAAPRHILVRFLQFTEYNSEQRNLEHFSGMVQKWTFSWTSLKMFKTRDTNSWRSGVYVWSGGYNTQCSIQQCFGLQWMEQGIVLKSYTSESHRQLSSHGN